MPTTPGHSLPYPAGTDPVSDGAVNFQNLANAVDPALLPKGGAANQHLVKTTSTDYQTAWATPPAGLPAGGTAGQIMVKNTSTDYDLRWANQGIPVPVGGALGAYLAKKSAADGDLQWTPVGGGWVPAGGAAGQVLTKSSGADFATGWQTPTGGGGSGATTWRDTSVIDATLTTSEIDVLNFAIPANTLATDRRFHILVSGDYLRNGSGYTTARVYIGPTMVYTTLLNPGANATRRRWRLDLDLLAAGAANAQLAYGLWYHMTAIDGQNSSPTAGAWIPLSIGPLALDSTQPITLRVTGQPTASEAGTSMRRSHYWAELV